MTILGVFTSVFVGVSACEHTSPGADEAVKIETCTLGQTGAYSIREVAEGICLLTATLGELVS